MKKIFFLLLFSPALFCMIEYKNTDGIDKESLYKNRHIILFYTGTKPHIRSVINKGFKNPTQFIFYRYIPYYIMRRTRTPHLWHMRHTEIYAIARPFAYDTLINVRNGFIDGAEPLWQAYDATLPLITLMKNVKKSTSLPTQLPGYMAPEVEFYLDFFISRLCNKGCYAQPEKKFLEAQQRGVIKSVPTLKNKKNNKKHSKKRELLTQVHSLKYNK